MGRIQQIQSFSTFDGPGTRCVVFLQGCPMGCIFCHNPDSWDAAGGEEVGVEELIHRIERFRRFLSAPGLTLTGGEPLLQAEFTAEVIDAAHERGWHVALDTSGWGPEERFMQVAGKADLVMFSIKHPLEPELVANHGAREALANWRNLARLSVPVWLRYVLITGRTDQPEALRALGELAKEQPNLERVEILPYNSLAENKWAKLGWRFPLHEGADPKVTEEQIRQAEMLVGWKKL
ncbi:MAG TPA: radical SAM protein [Firmicutes bacterium]|nr:radical SAM protein [Bacillota bacterium]HPT67178.1 radical SAM protein [Bacillota bacterium]